MDLTFIGILVTVLIGIPGVIIWFKKYQRRLIFIKDEAINLYNEIARDINDLKITFKGKEISKYIYLVRGFIFCKGKKDITEEEIIKYPYLSLPDNSNWLDYKILSTSEDMNAIIISDNKNLEFQFSLFKNNEFIYFQGLFETNEVSKDVDKNLIIKHRIANLGTVKKMNKISPVKDYVFALVVLAFCIWFFSYFSLGGINFNKVDEYRLIGIFDENSRQITEEEFRNSIQSNTINRNDGSSAFPVPDTLGFQINSVKQNVIDEYNLIGLIFQSTTKKYKLYDKYFVEFKIKYPVGLLIFSGVFFMVDIFCLFLFLSFIGDYFRYKKISNIINGEKQKLQIDTV